MRGDAWLLPVCADGDGNARARQLGRLACGVVIDIILLGRHLPPGVGCIEDRRRFVLRQQRVVARVAVRAPIGVARRAAIGDDQGRSIANLGLGEELHDVIVEDVERDIVLERGVAVGDQVDVHTVKRPALRNRPHVRFDRGGDDLLALFASRLIVILDAMRPLRLQSPDVRTGIVKAVDLRIDIGLLGAIDDLAGRKGAGGEDQPGTLHFQGREHCRRTARRIVPGGDAQRKVGHHFPILLRRQLIDAIWAVRMGIDQPGNDRLARRIDGRCPRRYGDARARPDTGDAVAFDEDDAVLDDPPRNICHRHQFCAGDRDAPARAGGGDGHR